MGTMTEFGDAQAPSASIPPEVQKAYENSIVAVKIAKEKYRTASEEEIVREAEITRKTLRKLRDTIFEIHGADAFDNVEWQNMGNQQTSDDRSNLYYDNSIWYLAKDNFLATAPIVLKKSATIPFKISAPDFANKAPVEAPTLEWILKGEPIASMLARYASLPSRPPKS